MLLPTGPDASNRDDKGLDEWFFVISPLILHVPRPKSGQTKRKEWPGQEPGSLICGYAFWNESSGFILGLH